MNAPIDTAIRVSEADLTDPVQVERIEAFVAERRASLFHRPAWLLAVERGTGQKAGGREPPPAPIQFRQASVDEQLVQARTVYSKSCWACCAGLLGRTISRRRIIPCRSSLLRLKSRSQSRRNLG